MTSPHEGTLHMKRRNRKPAPLPTGPTQWDQGAQGSANRLGLVIEPVGDGTDNPNGILRARRVDMLEVWHRKGTITTAGFNAAEALRNAFENTQRAPGWPDSERVDSSPKPDHAVTIQIDRLSAYHAISRHIITGDAGILSCCVLQPGLPSNLRVDNRRPYHGAGYQRGLEHLRDALDRLAKTMGG